MRSRSSQSRLVFLSVMSLLLIADSLTLRAAQKPEHTGTRLQGYAIEVTPHGITVFDKKDLTVELQTDKDYTALVGIGAAVTVWYTTNGGVNHLENIVYPASGGTFVSTDLIRRDTHRIIILPKAEDVENTKGLMDALASYLADNAGWFVAPSDLAAEIAERTRVPGSSLDAINSDTGDVDMQRFLQRESPLVVTIATDTHSDAVLEVKVVKVKAAVRSSIAAWDGVTEPVSAHKSHSLSPFGGGGKGWAYAATTDMSLWSRTGQLLWKKRRGFALLGVQAGGPKFRERPLAEVYANSDFMQRWLADTLGDLAPPRGNRAAQ